MTTVSLAVAGLARCARSYGLCVGTALRWRVLHYLRARNALGGQQESKEDPLVVIVTSKWGYYTYGTVRGGLSSLASSSSSPTPLFDSMQCTWNVLDQSAELALMEAYETGRTNWTSPVTGGQEDHRPAAALPCEGWRLVAVEA
jgi:hypothetical protein